MKNVVKIMVACTGLLITMPSAMEGNYDVESYNQDYIGVESASPSSVMRANSLVVDSSITSGGVSWSAFAKDNARIYINNTTGENMHVSLRKNGFSYASFDVRPGRDTFVFNGLGKGHFSLDFTTSSGRVSGDVAVRISDQPF